MAVAGTDTDVTTSGSANDDGGGRGQSNNAVATAATTAQSKPLATDSNNNGIDFKPNAKSSVTSKVVVDSESVKTKDTAKVLASSDYGNKDSAPENGKTAQLNGHVPSLSLTTPKRQRRKGKSVIDGAQSEGGNSASEQSGSNSSDSKWDQSVSVAPDTDSVSESNHSSVPVVRVTLPEDRVPQQANPTDIVASDTVANAESNGIDVKSDDGVGLFRPIKPILLLPFAPLPDDVSYLPVTSSATSSRGAASPVSTSGPVPPVPSAMAEAISRQQKGTGVRYWKTKQNGGDGGGGGGGGEGVSTSTSSMFPALRSSNEQPAAGSWGRNGNKVTKARERLRKQRVGYGYSLNDVSVREEALRRCGGNNGVNVQLSPHNATQHMFGHSLALPQPPPAYKRSVTGIGDYSHFLQLESSSHSSPLSNHLTDASSSSPSLTFPHQPNALPPSLTPTTDSPKPILKVKLTHSPNSPRSSSHPLGQLPQGAALDPADVTGDSGRSNDSFMISGDSNNNAMTTVGALTCMQLADTILGTKIHDFARLYQLCETKIRYVDFLERAALRHGNALTSLTDAPLRCNTWVSTPVDSSSKTSSNGAKTTNNRRNGKGGKTGNSLILPALMSPSNGLVSPGNGLSNGFASPSNDFAFLGSRSEGDTPLSSPPPPIHIPPFPSGKPILKTLNNQDAAVVRLNNLDLGSGSQRSGSGSLKPDPHPAPFSVRGATVYGAPVSGNDGGRKSQNSAAGQSAMSVRKRAVRFSIADQVKEYTPGEPVNQ